MLVLYCGGLILMLRLVLGFGLFEVVGDNHRVEGGVVLLLLVWAPMASLAAWDGDFVKPIWWPGLSLFPFLKFLKIAGHPIQTIRSAAKHLRTYWRIYAYFAFFSALGLIAIPAVNQVEKGGKSIILWFAASYGLLAAIVLCGIYLWFRDFLRFRRFQAHPSTLAARDFLEALGEFRVNSFRIRFIRAVSLQSCLPASDEVLVFVRNLNLMLEREFAIKDGAAWQTTGINSLDRWREHYEQANRRKISQWGKPVLDELLALEQRLTELRPQFTSPVTMPPTTQP